MEQIPLFAVIMLMPMMTLPIELLGDNVIIERHHLHHDTYLVPRSISSALMLMMLFVGMLGVVVGWLCNVGVFHADIVIVLAFFATFIMATFVLWLGIRRYRLMTYDDRLQVRGFAGPTRIVRYADITEIRRLPRTLNNYQSVRVYAGETRIFLWGLLDLDQILARIDRFDVLVEGDAG